MAVATTVPGKEGVIFRPFITLKKGRESPGGGQLALRAL